MNDLRNLQAELATAISHAAQARANLNIYLRLNQTKDQEVYKVFDEEVRSTEREMRSALSAYVMTLAGAKTREGLHARRSA